MNVRQLLHVPPVYNIRLGLDSMRIAWFYGPADAPIGPFDSREAAESAAKEATR